MFYGFQPEPCPAAQVQTQAAAQAEAAAADARAALADSGAELQAAREELERLGQVQHTTAAVCDIAVHGPRVSLQIYTQCLS